MSGISSVLSDGQSSMFRLQQAKKTWERDMEAMDAKDATQRLADKAATARQPFALTPKQQQERTSALNAMEEAKRVGGPKAAAEQKLEEVERKIAELKLMMRYSHGNREKLAQLAREAAILAREAGRAAKEYGQGVAAAAEMGLPGGAGTGAAGTEITRTITRTSLTVVQTEMTVEVQVTLSPDAIAKAQSGEGAAAALAQGAAASADSQGRPADDPPAGAADAVEAEAASLADQALGDVSSDGATSDGATSGDAASGGPTPGVQEARNGAGRDDEAANAMPSDLAEAVRAALGGLQPGSGALSTNGKRALLQRMIADNDLKMSRYREADEFGRRVEKVLETVKSVIGEAKVANEADQAEERRKARRESFKAYDKIVEGAQDEVNGLRQAAFGSGLSPQQQLDVLTGTREGDAAAAFASGAASDAAFDRATNPGGITADNSGGGIIAPSADAAGGAATLVNLLA